MDTQTEFDAQENFSASEQTQIAATLEKILDLQNKNSRQLVQSLRENVNFQNQVRQGMQRELDTLKEQQRGEQLTPILKSIAAVYVEYRKILADEAVPKRTRRTLSLMFDELEDILAEYDAEVFTSAVGETHTIAKSRRPGVIRNGRPLYREFVDVYVFDAAAGSRKSESVRTE